MLLHFRCTLSRYNHAFLTISPLFPAFVSRCVLLFLILPDLCYPPLLGKDEVGSSNLPSSSKKRPVSSRNRAFFMSKCSTIFHLLHFCFFTNGKRVSGADLPAPPIIYPIFGSFSPIGPEIIAPTGNGLFSLSGKKHFQILPASFSVSFPSSTSWPRATFTSFF